MNSFFPLVHFRWEMALTRVRIACGAKTRLFERKAVTCLGARTISSGYYYDPSYKIARDAKIRQQALERAQQQKSQTKSSVLPHGKNSTMILAGICLASLTICGAACAYVLADGKKGNRTELITKSVASGDAQAFAQLWTRAYWHHVFWDIPLPPVNWHELEVLAACISDKDKSLLMWCTLEAAQRLGQPHPQTTSTSSSSPAVKLPESSYDRLLFTLPNVSSFSFIGAHNKLDALANHLYAVTVNCDSLKQLDSVLAVALAKEAPITNSNTNTNNSNNVDSDGPSISSNWSAIGEAILRRNEKLARALFVKYKSSIAQALKHKNQNETRDWMELSNYCIDANTDHESVRSILCTVNPKLHEIWDATTKPSVQTS